MVLNFIFMSTIAANPDLNKTQNKIIFFEEEIKPPDLAFIFSASLIKKKLYLKWEIEQGSYLYMDKFSFLDEKRNSFLEPSFPPAIDLKDEYFGKVKVYFNRIELSLVIQDLKDNRIKVSYQGCNKKGYCYSLIKKVVTINGNSLKIES